MDAYAFAIKFKKAHPHSRLTLGSVFKIHKEAEKQSGKAWDMTLTLMDFMRQMDIITSSEFSDLMTEIKEINKQ